MQLSSKFVVAASSPLSSAPFPIQSAISTQQSPLPLFCNFFYHFLKCSFAGRSSYRLAVFPWRHLLHPLNSFLHQDFQGLIESLASHLFAVGLGHDGADAVGRTGTTSGLKRCKKDHLGLSLDMPAHLPWSQGTSTLIYSTNILLPLGDPKSHWYFL